MIPIQYRLLRSCSCVLIRVGLYLRSGVPLDNINMLSPPTLFIIKEYMGRRGHIMGKERN